MKHTVFPVAWVAWVAWLPWIVGSIALLSSAMASAQFSMRSESQDPFEWRGHVTAKFQAEFETDTEGGDRFESVTSTLAGSFGGPINESILLGIEAAYQFADYDFHLDGPPGVPATYGSDDLPRKPWGPINTFDIVPNTTILVGSKFSVIIAAPIRFSAETGSQRNALTAGASAIVRWQITDDLRLGAGLGVTSQIEDDAETFPIVTLQWNVTPDLELRTEGSWAQGGQAVLLWGPNKAVRLSFSAGYERNRFRLDDNGFVSDRNGIGEITAVPIEVGLRLRLYEDAFFDFRVGLGVAGRFRVESSTGNELYDERYDPAPRIGIGLTLPFGVPSRTAPDA